MTNNLLADTMNLGFPIGNQAITGRKKLSGFFHLLNQNPDSQKHVIRDIFFKDTSPDDSALEAESLKYQRNNIVSYRRRYTD